MKKIEIPTNCPSCNYALKMYGEYLICENSSNCLPQIYGRIKNWIKDLNILDFGETLIERLVEIGKINTVADLYKLTVDDLASIERMGKKSAKTAYDNLWKSSEIDLDVFLGALSMNMIGQSTIKAIMKSGCDTLDKFSKLGAIQFESVPGVGPIKAKFLADGLKNNEQIISDLLLNGVKIKKITVGKLTGKNFAITGTLSIKRAEVEKLIQENGGEVKNNVGKGLLYLIIADPNSNSSKAQAARKFGTILINEAQFLEMVK